MENAICCTQCGRYFYCSFGRVGKLPRHTFMKFFSKNMLPTLPALQILIPFVFHFFKTQCEERSSNKIYLGIMTLKKKKKKNRNMSFNFSHFSFKSFFLFLFFFIRSMNSVFKIILIYGFRIKNNEITNLCLSRRAWLESS